VGNRTAGSGVANTSYTLGTFNRLASTNIFTYSYDNNGNLVSKDSSLGSTQYTYDFENRLTQADVEVNSYPVATSTTVNYQYDALGRRIQRSTSDGALNFVYDGQDVIDDLDRDEVITSYLNGPGIDNKIRQTDVNGDLYYTTDHLGSTIALTNDSGTMVEGISYDSFGNSTSSSLTRYTYTGREFEADTGVYYYRARWYDPQVGRFITEDPIGFEGGPNWYVYVMNQPINFKDPEGLRIWVCSRLAYSFEGWVGANHSYLFDDRNGGSSCGLTGPRKPMYPMYGTTKPFYGGTDREKGPNEHAPCRPVDGSDDPQKADEIMNCCRNYNSFEYVPWRSDCHNLTHSCVTNAGLKDPGAPGGRFGERCVKCSLPPAPKIDWSRSQKCWGGARGC
jgi:RHS repeat-associated protein